MSEFTFDHETPLARCKGETRKAHDALQDYWLMGSGRSIRKLLQKYNEPDTESPPTRHFATLAGWSTRYAWQARIDRAKQIDDEALQREWEDRRKEWKQEEWDIAAKLLERAQQMLTFPVAEVTYQNDDDSVQIVKPAKWKPVDIARFAEVASKLARLAAEMETERRKSENLNIDLSNLTDDQLQRIASGEDPIHVLATTEGAGSA